MLLAPLLDVLKGTPDFQLVGLQKALSSTLGNRANTIPSPTSQFSVQCSMRDPTGAKQGGIQFYRNVPAMKPVKRSCPQTKKMSWEDRYEQLKEFYKIHGHCNVTQHDKSLRSLGNWVSKQRQRKKKGYKTKYSKLSEWQVSKLDEIGFEWDRSNWPQKRKQQRLDSASNSSSSLSPESSAPSSPISPSPTLMPEVKVLQPPEKSKLEFLLNPDQDKSQILELTVKKSNEPIHFHFNVEVRSIAELRSKLLTSFACPNASLFLRFKRGQVFASIA
jgi:hypothetical protein